MYSSEKKQSKSRLGRSKVGSIILYLGLILSLGRPCFITTREMGKYKGKRREKRKDNNGRRI